MWINWKCKNIQNYTAFHILMSLFEKELGICQRDNASPFVICKINKQTNWLKTISFNRSFMYILILAIVLITSKYMNYFILKYS